MNPDETDKFIDTATDVERTAMLKFLNGSCPEDVAAAVAFIRDRRIRRAAIRKGLAS